MTRHDEGSAAVARYGEGAWPLGSIGDCRGVGNFARRDGGDGDGEDFDEDDDDFVVSNGHFLFL